MTEGGNNVQLQQLLVMTSTSAATTLFKRMANALKLNIIHPHLSDMYCNCRLESQILHPRQLFAAKVAAAGLCKMNDEKRQPAIIPFRDSTRA